MLRGPLLSCCESFVSEISCSGVFFTLTVRGQQRPFCSVIGYRVKPTVFLSSLTVVFLPPQVENSPSAPPVQTPTLSDNMSRPVSSNHVAPLQYKSSRLAQTQHDRAMAFLWILSCLAFVGAAYGETNSLPSESQLREWSMLCSLSSISYDWLIIGFFTNQQRALWLQSGTVNTRFTKFWHIWDYLLFWNDSLDDECMSFFRMLKITHIMSAALRSADVTSTNCFVLC